MNGILNNLSVNNFSTASDINARCLKAAEGGIETGVLPNLLTESDISRFGLLNKLNEGKFLGKGYDAKMAQIYASSLKIYVYSRKIDINDLIQLQAGEVTDNMSMVYEALINSAQAKVNAWLTGQRNNVEAGKDQKDNFFGIG